MRNLRLIAFDLDGTLVDSRRDIAEAANELLMECGASPLAEEAIGRMVGDGAATLVARAFAAAALEPPPDALPRFLGLYGRRLTRHTRPYDGMRETLEALQSRYTLAVLTNKPLAATREILEVLALDPYFPPHLVYGGDGPHPRKPDPAGLIALAGAAGVAPANSCLVGDSAVDWQTARAAGTAICLARYGFGFHGMPLRALADEHPIVDHPSELLRFL